MSDRSDALALLAEVRTSRAVLGRVHRFYDQRFGAEGGAHESPDTAIVLAEILGNFSTGAETIFLRISHYFENALDAASWHRELLRKMTLAIPDIRPRIISDETYSNLRELSRFRHFRRYYLELEYRWDKLRLVEACYVRTRERLDGELDSCESYLQGLADSFG